MKKLYNDVKVTLVRIAESDILTTSGTQNAGGGSGVDNGNGTGNND